MPAMTKIGERPFQGCSLLSLAPMLQNMRAVSEMMTTAVGNA